MRLETIPGIEVLIVRFSLSAATNVRRARIIAERPEPDHAHPYGRAGQLTDSRARAAATAPNSAFMCAANGRVADHPIDPIFLERWSPRAFTGEPIPPEELFTLFEAARWAPSSSNSQPWRFLYARRDTVYWDQFLGLLNESNRAWAHRSAALVVIVSKSVLRRPGSDRDVPSYTHSFDAGAAWSNLALQAIRSGWHAHAMAGFDMERAFVELAVPAGFRVEAAVAIGQLGDPSLLSEQLQERERPSPRQPLQSTVFEGRFPA